MPHPVFNCIKLMRGSRLMQLNFVKYQRSEPEWVPADDAPSQLPGLGVVAADEAECVSVLDGGGALQRRRVRRQLGTYSIQIEM